MTMLFVQVASVPLKTRVKLVGFARSVASRTFLKLSDNTVVYLRRRRV